MLWLWILLAIILLAALLCLTRVGVWAAFGGEILRLDVRVGLLRIHILPGKSQKLRERKPKREKKPKNSEEEKTDAKPKPGMSIAFEDIRDALQTLLPPLGRALSRTRRGIRFKPLRLSLTLGGQENPAASAQLCGELQAVVWGGMPRLEELVDIRDPYIHMDVDFTAPDTVVEGEIGVTFRIGTLFVTGFGLAFPALKWFLRWRKRCKNRPPKLGKVKKKPKESPPEEPPPEDTKPREPAA